MGVKTATRYVSFRSKAWKTLSPPLSHLSGSQTLGNVRGYVFTRTGFPVAKWRTLIAQGLNASGSLSVTVQNAEATDLSSKLRWRNSSDPSSPGYTQINEGGVSGVFIAKNLPEPITAHLSGSDMTEARVIARRAINRVVTKRRRQVMGGVVIGELGKTVAMVLSPAKSLRSRMTTYLSKANSRLKRVSTGRGGRESTRKMIADTYLEAVFGWQPLLSDIRDGAIALARIVNRDALERQQFRGYGRDDHLVSAVIQNTSFGYDASSVNFYRFTNKVTHSSECILYGAFLTKLQDSAGANSAVQRLIQRSGFSFVDWAPTAWELIPMSFVVDYFLNVGDVLESTANVSHDIGWITEVTIVETKAETDWVIDVPAAKAAKGELFLDYEGAQSHSESSLKTVSRNALGGFDIQTDLRFRLPVGLQWLNLAALASQGKRPLHRPFY